VSFLQSSLSEALQPHHVGSERAAKGRRSMTRRWLSRANGVRARGVSRQEWRRERDSNPRYRFEGGTRDFQSRSFGQLGHLSANKIRQSGFHKPPLRGVKFIKAGTQLEADDVEFEHIATLRPTPEIFVNRFARLTKIWRRGWDSNPRAPLLTGQVDFESTPLRPLRYLSGRS
jgi:hypothetical protein